jgi:two-component system, cell cycle sensor histidine kinase and response regulator CckA
MNGGSRHENETLGNSIGIGTAIHKPGIVGGMVLTSELERFRCKVDELEKKCRQLEHDLRISEERFHNIFYAAPTMMAITSLDDGRIIDLNEASASIGGYSREELIGTFPATQMLQMRPEQQNETLEKLKQDGKAHNREMNFFGKAGEIHKVLYSGNPITYDNKPCLLSVSIDITDRENAAEVIKKSEEKYRLLVENSLQGLTIIQDYLIVFCNHAFAAITGYSVEELLSLPDTKLLIHPDDWELVVVHYRKCLAGEPVAGICEYRLVGKDGTERLVEASASLMEYNGKPAVQLVHMDITERRQAENALRESEERFRRIAETINEIFWIYDVEKEVATYISPAFDRIWGLSREHLIGNPNPSMDAIHPDDREQMNNARKFPKTRESAELEFRIIRPDGEVRHIWSRGFAVPDKTGKVRQFVGIDRDITEWKHDQQALKESEEYLYKIINRIGDPIFVKNREHNLVLFNDALCAFAGLPRDRLIGKQGMPIEKEVAEHLWKMEEEVFETGKESLSEDIINDGRGNTHIVLTRKFPLTDKNGNPQIVGVLRDITEYKRLEAQFLQSQKMEAIGVLAGGVAHDFNNLLNIINGYSELALDELDADNPIRRNIKEIQDAGQRAAALTSQLLAFGRKQILQLEILDLNTVIGNIISMLRRLIGEDIDFIFKTQPDIGKVHADPAKIQQIILNLVVNARDAMPGGGKLVIEIANVDFKKDIVLKNPILKPGPYVMMAIGDNGIGMNAEIQARIFEPFFTTKAKGKGTGLGLSTVYGIVKQSNGFIQVFSEPGKGSTFTIYFPRIESGEAKVMPEIMEKPEKGGRETILIAEDEEAVRSLTSRILSNRGYHVLEATDGLHALRIAQDHAGKIDLILTDIIMPGISGSTLVARLRAKRPDIRTLFISGYTDNAIVHNGILDDNIAFLQKPFTLDALVNKVRKVLNSPSEQISPPSIP